MHSSPSSTGTHKEAYVTLVTTESYIVGAQVLAKSLRETRTTRPIICLVTSNLSEASFRALKSDGCFDEVRLVEPLDSGDKQRLALLGRPELGCTFTKIQVWNQLDLAKVVFFDADMLVIKNVDELFGREEFSAAPDVGWPDCFNSGLFVCRPNRETYTALLQMAKANGSFDGGDQGLLNQYFASWSTGDPSRRLPFGYNLTFSASYSYLPAFKHFEESIKAVHFIGTNKPWTFHRLSDGRVCPRGDYHGEHMKFVQKWWALHDLLQSPKSPNHLNQDTGYSRLCHEYSTAKFFQSAPASPVSFGCDAPNFANYKISWSSDIEAQFEDAEEDPHLNPHHEHHRDALKIAYKMSNTRPKAS